MNKKAATQSKVSSSKAEVTKHIYLIELKVMTLGLPAWMDIGGCTKLTHQGLVQCLKVVVMTDMMKEPRQC